jgi:hypothetical protein
MGRGRPWPIAVTEADMASQDTEEADNLPAVTGVRSVDFAVSVLLILFSALMAYDNWRTGISWDVGGPQAGYFPFYLSLIMGIAALYGAVKCVITPDPAVFVTRSQLKRVSQMFVPTVLFVVVMQWLGLYVASFILVAGFMIAIGRIAVWKSLLTAAVFTVTMFVIFEIAFDVIMPKGPLEALLGY